MPVLLRFCIGSILAHFWSHLSFFQLVTKRTFSENSLSIEDGNGDKVEAYFNDVGQLVKFKDGGNNEYTIELNDNGTLDTVTYPDGSTKTYSYFENGHMTKTQNEAEVRYEFDDKGRLIMKDFGEGFVSSYSYDSDGSLTKAENEKGEISIVYSGSNIKYMSYGEESTISYNYNDDGLITDLTTNDGYSVSYNYNYLRQLEEVYTGSRRLLNAEYTSSGKIKRKVLGNNASTVFEYDKTTGLLTSLTNYYPNGTISSFFAYKYSTRNRRVAVTSNEGTWRFQYDRSGQVTSMTEPHGIVTQYRYDNRKNREAVVEDNVERRNEVNEMNQYVQYGETNIVHDKNGNLIKKVSSIAGNSTYVYDEDNKLIAYTGSNGASCQFKYDALGNLKEKVCDGHITRYLVSMQGIYDTDILEKVMFISKSRIHLQVKLKSLLL